MVCRVDTPCSVCAPLPSLFQPSFIYPCTIARLKLEDELVAARRRLVVVDADLAAAVARTQSLTERIRCLEDDLQTKSVAMLCVCVCLCVCL